MTHPQHTMICLTKSQHKCVSFKNSPIFAMQRACVRAPVASARGSAQSDHENSRLQTFYAGGFIMAMPTTAAQTHRPGRGRVFDSIVDAVGDTPIVRLSTLPEQHGVNATILAKLEYFNP